MDYKVRFVNNWMYRNFGRTDTFTQTVVLRKVFWEIFKIEAGFLDYYDDRYSCVRAIEEFRKGTDSDFANTDSVIEKYKKLNDANLIRER